MIALFLLVPLVAGLALGANAVLDGKTATPALEDVVYYCPNARALQAPEEFSFSFSMEISCLLQGDMTYYLPDPLAWRWDVFGA